MRATPPKNSFVSGVLSPRLEARTDIRQYPQGARQMVNAITRPHGGAFKRPGTIYMGATKHPGRKVRLIPFEFSTEQAYLLEVGDRYMRFWTARGLVLAGGNVLEVETPYSEADLDELQKTQDADVAIFVHPRFQPHKLSRTALDAFTFAPVEFMNGRAPVRPFNGDADNRVQTTGTWPSLTLTWDKDTLNADLDTGRIVYVRDGKEKRAVYARIASVTSAKVAAVEGLYRTPTDQLPTATDRWALGAFSDAEGCRAVAFHEGRLWYGGFLTEPDYLVGSVSASFDNFELENPANPSDDALNDDKSITRRCVSGGQVSTILWLRSVSESLVVGTAGAEFVVSSSGGVLTPTDCAVRASTTRGSAPAVPTGVDNQLFYLQQGGFKIRQFAYALEADNFRSEDVTLLAEHLARRGLAEIAYQQDPDSVLWVRRRDNSLVGWTVERSQEVMGAHEHPLGGVLEDTGPQVLSMAVLPGASAAPAPVTLSGMPTPRSVGINMSFNTPDMVAWTSTFGTWEEYASVTGMTAPYQGVRFATVTDTVGLEYAAVEQTIVFNAFVGWNQALVTAGRTEIDLSAALGWATDPTASASRVGVKVDAYDNAMVHLGQVIAVERTSSEATTGNWLVKSEPGWTLPAGTDRVKVVCYIEADTAETDIARGCVDIVSLVIRQRPLIDNPGREIVEDALWLVVNRTIDGGTKTYVERIAPSFAPDLGPASTDEDRRMAVERAVFLDCSATFSDSIPLLHVEDGDPPRFITTVPHSLAVGSRVMVRGALWRNAARDLNNEFHNGVPFVVQEVPSPTEIVLADLDGNQVAPPAGWGFVAWDAAIYREVSSVFGLNHLIGEPVRILANGKALPVQTVDTAGGVHLPEPASIVTVGLPYTYKVETTRFFGTGGRQYTDEAAPVLVSEVRLRVVDTLGGKVGVGPRPAVLYPLNFADGEDPMNRPFPLLSGDLRVPVEGSWTDPPTVYIEHDEPYPIEVLGVYPIMESNPK